MPTLITKSYKQLYAGYVLSMIVIAVILLLHRLVKQMHALHLGESCSTTTELYC